MGKLTWHTTRRAWQMRYGRKVTFSLGEPRTQLQVSIKFDLTCAKRMHRSFIHEAEGELKDGDK